jgi:hypothetical protein
MSKKTPKQQSKPSTTSVAEISKKIDTELTEEQLGKVSAGAFTIVRGDRNTTDQCRG